MRLLRFLLAVLCIAFGIGVAALNGAPVRLDLLWVAFDLPLGLLLLGVLLLGTVLGAVTALLSRWADRLALPPADGEAPDA
jgi:putative membrane protein